MTANLSGTTHNNNNNNNNSEEQEMPDISCDIISSNNYSPSLLIISAILALATSKIFPICIYLYPQLLN